MIKTFTIMLVVIACSAAIALAGTGALDGKTFEGTTGEKGKKEEIKDTLVFADGMFHSSGCDVYGFKPVAYKTSSEGQAVKFEATAASEKEGSMKWTGTVTGDHVEAASVWHKEGQKDIEYWFKGSLKK